MKHLGISCAVDTIGAALIDENKILAEFSTSGRDAKSENLVSIIDSVLSKADTSISKINGISVTRGPGSYSGLRGGLAVAKSFSQSLKVPLAGVSTLDAVAYNFIDNTGTVAVMLHACKDEYNTALFAINAGKINRAG